MLNHLFETHGRFCAGHPLEVIVATLTLTACTLNMDTGGSPTLDSGLPMSSTHCRYGRCGSEDVMAADIILMTIIRCLAILYSYHQFHNIQNLGSKYILSIAGLFTVFSSIIFTWSVLNFGRNDLSDLKDALFFFLLLIDLNKAGVLAQLALNSKNQDEVRANIARGMSLLGPTVTLDTLVEILLIGIGSLSGVRRLEVLCTYACLGVVVNYVVFMTFYPACLSLILELSRSSNDQHMASHGSFLKEEEQKPNPVVERVKLIMIAGLFIVHAHSRWPFHGEDEEESIVGTVAPVNPNIILTNRNKTEASPDLRSYLINWLSVSAENVVVLILLLALAIKFIFFEGNTKQLRFEEECEVIEPTRQRTRSSCRLQEDYSHCTPAMDCEIRDLEDRFRKIPKPSPVFPIMSDSDENDDSKHVELVDKEVQTKESTSTSYERVSPKKEMPTRSVEECLTIYRSELGASGLSDAEVIQLVNHKYIQPYQLEKAVGCLERGVAIRRLIIGTSGAFTEHIKELPYREYDSKAVIDYSKVLGSCCENVVGYVPVPLGMAGPLLLDGELVYVPMATTEGCLVASTNRGSRALRNCGVSSRIVADGMTRGPVVRLPSAARASEVMAWMEEHENYQKMKQSFDETSRYARLTGIHVRIAGRHVFIRFVAKTGDAMGMNMLSKGTERSLHTVQELFPDMEILSLSGNFCTDKKPAAVNWLMGRGKSVVCEAIVPADVVQNVLKTSTHAIVDVNISKNMVGSAMAGSIGGFNAHAANIVTAIYIATGQDPAQNVGSSNCMTLMEPWGPDGRDLYVSCTMPSIEIGTIGGGTGLPAQSVCLSLLGVKGAHAEEPGQNARKLARIVCATVLAGELSLMAALTAGHLVKSHLRHNRSSTTVSNPVCSTAPTKDLGVNLMVPNILSTVQQPVCESESQDS